VVVRIDGAGDRFFVSDHGMGYEEAYAVNDSRRFGSVARALIAGTDLAFDGRFFYAADATNDELVGVVGAIANVSQRAVIEVTLKHEAKKVESDRKLLIDRLEHAFGVPRVVTDFTIRGASNVEWDVTARVETRDNVVSIFDYVKHHKNSVSSTVAMFHDIARLEMPPKRIVTVRDMSEMGLFVGLLSQAASVIELPRTNDDTLRRLAAA
jgi:hypothetical protein